MGVAPQRGAEERESCGLQGPLVGKRGRSLWAKAQGQSISYCLNGKNLGSGALHLVVGCRIQSWAVRSKS